MSYYNWTEIVSSFSNNELINIIRDLRTQPDDKVSAALYELKNRGIETDNYENMIESYNNMAPDSSYIYAGFWIRLGSLLLDFIIVLPISIIILLINSVSKEFFFYTLFPYLLFELWYNIYLVKTFGGTPGKLITGIKIIKLNNQPIGWREAILRHLVNLILTLYGYIIITITILNIKGTYFNHLSWLQQQAFWGLMFPLLFSIYKWLTNIWTYSELIVLLTNNKKRAIHDFIAGTVIVKAKYIDELRKNISDSKNDSISSN